MNLHITQQIEQAERWLVTLLFTAYTVFMAPVLWVSALTNDFPPPHMGLYIMIVLSYTVITGIAHLKYSSVEREYKEVLLHEDEKTWVEFLPIALFAWVLIPVDAVTWTVSTIRTGWNKICLWCLKIEDGIVDFLESIGHSS